MYRAYMWKKDQILHREVHHIQLHLDALDIVLVEPNMQDSWPVYSTMGRAIRNLKNVVTMNVD